MVESAMGLLIKKLLIATLVGGVSGTLMLYLLTHPLILLISVLLGALVAVAFYVCILRQRMSLAEGTLLGFLTGVVISFLIVIMTIIQTGLNTLEFAASVTFFPRSFGSCPLPAAG